MFTKLNDLSFNRDIPLSLLRTDLKNIHIYQEQTLKAEGDTADIELFYQR